MPYKSDAQARLMRAVAHSPEFAKKVGISQSVGQKFEAHKAVGGTVKESEMKKVFAGKESAAEESAEKKAAKKAGMSYKAAEKKFEGEKYCGGGKTKGYADGGATSFKEAFAEARKSGDKTFEWNGKKYTTDLASPSVGDGRARSVRSGNTGMDRARRAGAAFSTYDRIARDIPEGTSPAARAAIEANRDYARGAYEQAAVDQGAYAKGGITAMPINDDMGSDTTYDRKKAMARTMPPAPKPAKRTLAIEPDMGSAERTPYKKGGSVRGVGIAKRGFGCGGKVKR